MVGVLQDRGAGEFQDKVGKNLQAKFFKLSKKIIHRIFF